MPIQDEQMQHRDHDETHPRNNAENDTARAEEQCRSDGGLDTRNGERDLWRPCSATDVIEHRSSQIGLKQRKIKELRKPRGKEDRAQHEGCRIREAPGQPSADTSNAHRGGSALRELSDLRLSTSRVSPAPTVTNWL